MFNDEAQFPRNNFAVSLTNLSGVVSVFPGPGRVHSAKLVGGTGTALLFLLTDDELGSYETLRARTADSTAERGSFYAASGLKVQYAGTGAGFVSIWWS